MLTLTLTRTHDIHECVPRTTHYMYGLLQVYMYGSTVQYRYQSLCTFYCMLVLDIFLDIVVLFDLLYIMIFLPQGSSTCHSFYCFVCTCIALKKISTPNTQTQRLNKFKRQFRFLLEIPPPSW